MMKHHGHSGSVVSAAICKDTKVKMEAQDTPHITPLARKSHLLKTGGVMAGFDCIMTLQMVIYQNVWVK